MSPSEASLQRVMQRANISSQRALAEKANVSRWQVQQLRQGNIDAMRLSVLKKMAMALDCSLADLLQTFDPARSENVSDAEAGASVTAEVHPENKVTSDATSEAALLRQEYTRLEKRLEQQSHSLRHQFQTDALQVLESWLTYWPTAAKAAMERDDFDAKKLLPLVKPVDRLVASWGVTVMGRVGEQLAYDPQQHQLTRGTANAGDPVRISHVGYRHGESLLQRVKVVPLNPD
ncbi:helix-turn-helix domain-containing protein [Leptothoe spongobia]|uniref:Helix-turn-helix transcriptional regulator n=1 Tax=Leptothoe spongobia TAU-MAC 1115 TaxID=1967444 RepID=A0A947GMJ0_9CYAN|nr:helix-turn-helix transcriptional regulator [Leptothoe spongobia]MBT9318058.1 helix-turn-helix transcriptional regulator [Leptothoe spongobia TAU-MAC 1115]